MKYKQGTDLLGLPTNYKFGIEIEADNVATRGKDSLYHGQSADYIRNQRWHFATQKEEALVGEGGAELVSPILKDQTQDWQSIVNMCNHIQQYPGNKRR